MSKISLKNLMEFEGFGEKDVKHNNHIPWREINIYYFFLITAGNICNFLIITEYRNKVQINIINERKCFLKIKKKESKKINK